MYYATKTISGLLFSGRLPFVMLALALCSVGCTSKRYVPQSLSARPESQLAGIKLQRDRSESLGTDVRVDGVQMTDKPARSLAWTDVVFFVEPGEHVFSFQALELRGHRSATQRMIRPFPLSTTENEQVQSPDYVEVLKEVKLDCLPGKMYFWRDIRSSPDHRKSAAASP